jgi:hypothetical protein
VETPACGWFRGAGLGLFVHWDHASQQGLELSWPLVGGIPVLPKCQSVPVAGYHASAATFDPHAWDPVGLARRAKPEILINDRLPLRGDFETPEQFAPAVPPERPWETCLTMNNSWGYNPSDRAYKSSRSLIHTGPRPGRDGAGRRDGVSQAALTPRENVGKA